MVEFERIKRADHYSMGAEAQQLGAGSKGRWNSWLVIDKTVWSFVKSVISERFEGGHD